MNVNVENAPTVRLRAEFTEPALDQLGGAAGSPSGPIRERINGAQFKFTNRTKFDVKELQVALGSLEAFTRDVWNVLFNPWLKRMKQKRLSLILLG